MEILELLTQSGLFAGEELSVMEKYLCGDLGDEVLEGFRYRNLAHISGRSKICGHYQEVIAGGTDELAIRLGKLFFALGQASAYAFYPTDIFSCEIEGLWREPSQKAAVFAMEMAMGRLAVNKETFREIMRMAKQNPKNLVRAMEYEGAIADSVCLLQTAYFAMAYPKGQGAGADNPSGNMPAGNKPFGNIPAGMGKLYESRTSNSQVMEQDIPLLEMYERSLLELLPLIYENQLSEDKIQKIVRAVEQDEVDRNILKLSCVPWGRVNRNRISFLSKCAYLNHTLSPVIRNIMSVCLGAQMDMVLECMEQVDLYGEVESKGGNFDLIFGVDSIKLVKWAARQGKDEILRVQFGRKPERFMYCMESMDYRTYNTMSRIVEEMGSECCRKWMGGELYRKQLKLVESFKTFIGKCSKVPDAEVEEDIFSYLCQEKGVEAVYDIKEALKDVWFWGVQVFWELERYQKKYGFDALSERCETLLLVGHGISIGHILNQWDGVKKNPEEVLERLFAVMESQGVDLDHQLDTYCFLYENAGLEEWEEVLQKVGKEIFFGCLCHERKEMLEAFRKSGSIGRKLGLQVMAREAEKNQEEILKYAHDTSKGVREALIGILSAHKDWEEEVEGLLWAKKASAREIGVRVLASWLEETLGTGKVHGRESGHIPEESKGAFGGKVTEVLTQALEREKNAKLREYLGKVLRINQEESGRGLREEALVKEIHKGNRKRALAWAYGTPFSKVHRKEGKEAEEMYLQAILLCYYIMGTEDVWQKWSSEGSIAGNDFIGADLLPKDVEGAEEMSGGVSRNASYLVEVLNKQEFEVYVGELFDRWLEAGAGARKRWVLYAAAAHGGGRMVEKIYHQIQEWPKEARGAMAVEAVMALALSPEKQALLAVEKIAWKFKYRQVQKAAGRAMSYAAARFGITREELEDRIMPHLGFDERVRRIFDYGTRKFTVTITTGFEIEVFEESGKKLKSLPKPGKRDEEAKAAVAFAEFGVLKKQLRDMASIQKNRMEHAFLTGRMWNMWAWRKLFVGNPIMHQFATGLVWGIYENGKLIQCYRYMEDGSCNTEEGEEYVFPKQCHGQSQAALPGQGADAGTPIGQEQEMGRLVGLVHPIELSGDSLKAWMEQLADYEMIQPIAQLDRPLFHRTEEEMNEPNLKRFMGMTVNKLALKGRLTAMGWERGNGGNTWKYDYYYREDQALSIKTVLRFLESGTDDKNDTVTVYEVSFYKTDDLGGENAISQDGKRAYLLKEVPERYFSEMVWQVSQAVGSGAKGE